MGKGKNVVKTPRTGRLRGEGAKPSTRTDVVRTSVVLPWKLWLGAKAVAVHEGVSLERVITDGLAGIVNGERGAAAMGSLTRVTPEVQVLAERSTEALKFAQNIMRAAKKEDK